MSDWEEYCESNGWNIGSEADYDNFLDGLEDRPSSERQLSSFPTAEIASTMSEDDLKAALLKGVCNNGVDVMPQLRRTSVPGCSIGIDVFDDEIDAPMPNCYLRIDHDNEVPITFLIDVMRTSGMPLLSENDGEWLAWDVLEQRVKCRAPSVEYLWNRARAKRPESSLDEHELHVIKLLHRAVLSTDHGKKPLLLQRDFHYEAMQRREVEFEDPRRILSKDIGRYMLAFYTSFGETASIPLEQVAKLGSPILTRTSAYMWRDGDLVPLLNNAKLLVGAFVIAVNHNPNEFQWFLARERGTVFHSAIERIEAPKDPHAPHPVPGLIRSNDSQTKTFVTRGEEDALQIASDIVEQASEHGTTYLTVGGHPLDVDFVTTPELYLHAVKTLRRYGYSIQYCLTNGVDIKKPEVNHDRICGDYL